MKDLSSAQYAYQHGIILQEHYYLKSDEYIDVYYVFKKEGRLKVAKKFKDKVHSLSCFPLTFTKKPQKSNLKFVLYRNAIVLGFLNKKTPSKDLVNYIHKVISNKYYMYNYSLSAEYYEKIIDHGKNKELEEMDFETKRYIWYDNHQKLNKKLKCKIMNIDRFKITVNENTNKIFDAVTDLLNSYDDFITTILIAKHAKINYTTTKKYIGVYREEIDSHNKAKYGTSNHNQYLLLISKEEITNAISNLKFKSQKVNIQTVADYTTLHRNTVAKINRKFNLF